MGARRPLTRERVLRAALELVDQEGLAALSMRRLGAELGVEAMSLYNHVPNKAGLLDGIVGEVWGEVELPADEPGPWAEHARHLARCFRGLAHAHPNVFPLLATRTVYADNALAATERALQTLRGAGFDADGAACAFNTLVGYVYGYSLREISLRPGERTHPWFDIGRVDGERFPLVQEMAPRFVHADLDAGFEVGLEVVLAGLAAQLAGCSAPGATGPRRPAS